MGAGLAYLQRITNYFTTIFTSLSGTTTTFTNAPSNVFPSVVLGNTATFSVQVTSPDTTDHLTGIVQFYDNPAGLPQVLLGSAPTADQASEGLRGKTYEAFGTKVEMTLGNGQQAVTEAEDRYLMTVIATASNPRFSVSRVDIDRPGPLTENYAATQSQHSKRRARLSAQRR